MLRGIHTALLFFSYSFLLEAEASTKRIHVTPLQIEENDLSHQNHGLKLSGETLREDISSFLLENIDRSDITVHQKATGPVGLGLTDADHSNIMLYKFAKEGIELCSVEVKAINIDGYISLIGSLPDVNHEQIVETAAPDFDASLKVAWNSIKSSSDSKQRYFNKSLCLFPYKQTLKPVWKLQVESDGMGYDVWADQERVYKTNRLFFDLFNAKIKTYLRDAVSTPNIESHDAPIEEKTLSNNHFVTNTSTEDSGIERAEIGVNNTFEFEPGTPQFNEASIFFHAFNHLNYFFGLGYTWSGNAPLILKINSIVRTSVNNASYRPPSGNELPLITVGNGDGTILRNLSSDSDVVSHEFGHHVIYRVIKDTTGESLVLHEGLADYFVFASTEDPCLGRSICVPGASGACVIKDQCLRIASKTLQYDNENFENYNVHFKGQLISGYIYGLHEQVQKNNVPKVTLTALGYMSSDSNFQDMLTALMLADYQINSGANACIMYDYALDRGFGALLEDVDCSNFESIRLNTDPVEATGETIKLKKKSGFLGCSGSSAPPDSFDLGLLFFFFPFFRRRKKPSK